MQNTEDLVTFEMNVFVIDFLHAQFELMCKLVAWTCGHYFNTFHICFCLNPKPRTMGLKPSQIISLLALD